MTMYSAVVRTKTVSTNSGLRTAPGVLRGLSRARLRAWACVSLARVSKPSRNSPSKCIRKDNKDVKICSTSSSPKGDFRRRNSLIFSLGTCSHCQVTVTAAF